MKYITLIIGLLVVGLLSLLYLPSYIVPAPTAKPTKELTLEEKVVGSYEVKRDGDTYRTVLLENGVAENYKNGKKLDDDKWSISKDGELHIANKDWNIHVIRINKDGNITGIADIEDGKREDFPKENQHTIQKIK